MNLFKTVVCSFFFEFLSKIFFLLGARLDVSNELGPVDSRDDNVVPKRIVSSSNRRAPPETFNRHLSGKGKVVRDRDADKEVGCSCYDGSETLLTRCLDNRHAHGLRGVKDCKNHEYGPSRIQEFYDSWVVREHLENALSTEPQESHLNDGNDTGHKHADSVVGHSELGLALTNGGSGEDS